MQQADAARQCSTTLQHDNAAQQCATLYTVLLPIFCVSSAFHSPMSKSCETMRVPGFSSLRMRGRNLTLTLGSRYIVTTVAREKSKVNTSPSSKRTSASICGPAFFAAARASRTRSGFRSTPTPRQPKRSAARITMRPSPQPGS
jgi:hypothetical protein